MKTKWIALLLVLSGWLAAPRALKGDVEFPQPGKTYLIVLVPTPDSQWVLPGVRGAARVTILQRGSDGWCLVKYRRRIHWGPTRKPLVKTRTAWVNFDQVVIAEEIKPHHSPEATPGERPDLESSSSPGASRRPHAEMSGALAVQAIKINVAEDGAVSIKGRKVTMIQLSALVAGEVKRNREPSVMIVADANAPIQTLESVMDTCRKAGIRRFKLESQ